MFNINKEPLFKTALFITGFAGSGKTTIAKIIAQKLKWAYLDKDTLCNKFTEHILEENGSKKGDRESQLYKEKILPIEYATLMAAAEENLQIENNVIICAPFISQLCDPNWLEKTQSTLRTKHDCKTKIVWVKANREIEKTRLVERNTERDQWKLDNWDQYAKNIKKLEIEKSISKLYAYNNETNKCPEFSSKIEKMLNWVSSNK